MTRSLPAALVVVAGLAWMVAVRVPAAGAPSRPTPATLSADDIRIDNRGTTLTARGHVAIAYGGLRVRSDVLTVDRPRGVASFTGHVALTDAEGKASADAATVTVVHEDRVTQIALVGRASVETPSYALLADRIVADRPRSRLTGAGHVTLFSQPDLIVTGALLTYDVVPQRVVVHGGEGARSTIQNRDGRIRGASMELARKTGQMVVHGPVEAEIYDATVTGAEAAIDLRGGTALITGHVTVSRRQGTLLADRLTVYYQSRRFIAEGATRMTLSDLDDASSP
jgi:lipopolysaccharide export system protein LptA